MSSLTSHNGAGLRTILNHADVFEYLDAQLSEGQVGRRSNLGLPYSVMKAAPPPRAGKLMAPSTSGQRRVRDPSAARTNFVHGIGAGNPSTLLRVVLGSDSLGTLCR